MKLTKQEFENFKPIMNHVLIKPDRRNDEVLIGTDDKFKLYLDTSWADGEHVCVTGTVVAVPDTLHHIRSEIPLMDWQTTMELAVGDKVWYDFVAGKNAFGNDRHTDLRFFEVGDDVYIAIQYSECFVARRGDQTIMLNGYILAEPIEEELKTTIELPDFLKKSRSAKFAKVVFVGSCNKSYLTLDRGLRKGVWINGDTDEISVGDVVAFSPFTDIELEYELHAKFDGKKTFLRIQRKYVNAIIKEEVLIN